MMLLPGLLDSRSRGPILVCYLGIYSLLDRRRSSNIVYIALYGTPQAAIWHLVLLYRQQ